MLSMHKLSKKTNINSFNRSVNYNKNVISGFVSYKRNFMTDATLINKNKLINEACVVTENVSGSVKVIKLNPGKNNANNYLTPDHFTRIQKSLSVYDRSNITEFIVLDSVTPGSIVSKGYDTKFIKALPTLEDDERISKTISLIKSSYDLATKLAKTNTPVVALLNGEANNAFNSFAALAPFRVSTEFTKWSMDHLKKGLLPDLASTSIIPRVTTLGGINGQLGIYLLLTGDVLSGEDAYIAGITTHYIPYDAVDQAMTRLTDLEVNHVKSKLKQEARVLNTQIVKEHLFKGEVTKEAQLFLHEENKKIKAKVTLKNYSEVLDEFAQPVQSLNRNYQFKYSPEALDVIEYAFNIIGHLNFSNQFIHKKIINRLLEIITCEDKKAFTIEWTDAHKKFASETLAKLNEIPEYLLQVTTRMIVANSEKETIEAALIGDQLAMSEFYSNDEYINNIENKDAQYKEDESFLDKFKNSSVEVFENVRMTKNKQFNVTMGNINESSIRKSFIKLGPVSNKAVVESRVLISSDYVSKTNSEYIINNLILNRCLLKEGNVLKWKKISKSVVLKPKQEKQPAPEPVVESVVEPVVEAVAEEEVAHEEEAVKADEKTSKPLSLADMMESDDFDIFGKSDDETTIYNDFFKDDK